MEKNDFNTTQMDSRERLRTLYLQPGDIIAERYEVVRELGQGGMGCVFLCRDIRADGREMALKTVPDVLHDNKEAVANLKREYNTMYDLTHDGIVAVRNLVEDDYRYYIVMDYVKGETLEAYLKKHPKPGLIVTLEVIFRMAAALDYANSKGVIHRDIKPANVMVQIDSGVVKNVKILDFGLGRCIRESFSRTTGSWMTGGTPAYKSPEQWNPEKYGVTTEKSDQYSLGVVAYEMLKGMYPFSGCDYETMGYSVLHISPAKIDDVSETVNNALQKALTKNPDERFVNCVAFAKVLGGRTDTVPPIVEYAPKHPLTVEEIPPPEVKKTSYHKAEATGRKTTLTIKVAEGLDLEFAWIPAGTFMMGSPMDELGRADDETLHQVTLTHGFWLGKYPVTQAQYMALVGKNPSYFLSFLGFMKEQNPVENVSWDDAIRYCYLLNETHATDLPSGYKCSLPTEAQWEYACRAGTKKALNNNMNLLNTNENEPRLNELGWYNMNSNYKTHPVGQKKPNAWGLYDMHGNVWEWCLDWYGNSLSETVTNPTGPLTGSYHVKRGGCWGSSSNYCRSACRYYEYQLLKYYGIGFRVVLVPVQ